MTLTPDDARHGTPTGYNWHRCRCEECRAAATAKRSHFAKQPSQTRARSVNVELAPDDPRHGRASTYQAYRCRCDACRTAATAARRAYLARNPEKKRELTERAKRRLAPGDPLHGTINGYNRHACRCALCLEARAGYNREQRTVNAERVRALGKAANHKRRARKQERDCGCVTVEALERVWDRDGGRCAYCGGPGEHVDHIVALAADGWHCVSNLRVACARCNCSKRERPLDAFLASLGDRDVAIMPNATAPGLPCAKAAARLTGWDTTVHVQDPWGMSA